jgi:LysM repeat protein
MPFAITSTTIILTLLALQLCQASPISFTAPKPIAQTRSLEDSTTTNLDGTTTYTIRLGDTFTSIATELGTFASVLESANPTLHPVDLQIGAIVLFPGNLRESRTSTAGK